MKSFKKLLSYALIVYLFFIPCLSFALILLGFYMSYNTPIMPLDSVGGVYFGVNAFMHMIISCCTYARYKDIEPLGITITAMSMLVASCIFILLVICLPIVIPLEMWMLIGFLLATQIIHVIQK